MTDRLTDAVMHEMYGDIDPHESWRGTERVLREHL